MGDTCRPAAGVMVISANRVNYAHLRFPALSGVPHLLAREIIMNRRHFDSFDVIVQMVW